MRTRKIEVQITCECSGCSADAKTILFDRDTQDTVGKWMCKAHAKEALKDGSFWKGTPQMRRDYSNWKL